MNLNRRNLLAGGLAAGLTAAAGGKLASAAIAPSSAKVRTIGLEEHCLPPAVADAWHNLHLPPAANPYRAAARGTRAPRGGMASVLLEGRPELQDWDVRLVDFEGQRLEDMDRAGIEMAVLSLCVNGPQGQPDPKRAHDMMVRGNDALAQQVSKHPDRFAGFACLSMHDVDAACREFERCVNDLGFHGVLLNNWQMAGANADMALTYDDRRYDPFWDTAQRLEAPVYLHPGWSPPWYGRGVKGLTGVFDSAGWNWAVEVGTHALRIITTGVFDRYPRAQMILGHNGEHIVTDLWRIENRVHGGWARLKGGRWGGAGNQATPYSVMTLHDPDYAAEKMISAYFRTNVWVTTSAQFNDAGLRHIIDVIGVDRIMFSTDYPYEDMVEGGTWFNAAPLSDDDRYAIGRGNHLKLFKKLALKS